MIFAPVIIPTLNRFEHFQRCIESLEKCTGASETEVFVALDYPPASKYVLGWEKISSYLTQKEGQNHFKKLHVIRRTHNFGVGHPNSNAASLLSDIKKQYDRYIFSEDDNEFSPCFLEYMNNAFEKFKDDPRINLICGYNFDVVYPESYRNNFCLTKNGCPWGIGEWVEKHKLVEPLYDLTELEKLLRDKQIVTLLKKRSPNSIRNIITMLKYKKLHGDAIKGIYTAIHDTYCVVPRVSLVRNWGNDGTGVHSRKMNRTQNTFFTQQIISTDQHFSFTDDYFVSEPEYLEKKQSSSTFMSMTFMKKMYHTIVFHLDYFLFRHFSYIPRSRFI